MADLSTVVKKAFCAKSSFSIEIWFCEIAQTYYYDRAQSCAIALRSPASERSSDLKRYSPDIHQGVCAVRGARGTAHLSPLLICGAPPLLWWWCGATFLCRARVPTVRAAHGTQRASARATARTLIDPEPAERGGRVGQSGPPEHKHIYQRKTARSKPVYGEKSARRQCATFAPKS